MFFLLFRIQKELFSNNHIKILDDNTMKDTIKKLKSSFIFFHQDHSLISDNAYFHYLKISNLFKNISNFFIISALNSADVSRTYNIPGYPSLLHFRMGSKTSIHHGLFSNNSIYHFINNWTQPQYINLNFNNNNNNNITKNEILNKIIDIYPDKTHILIIFSLIDSKFGQQAKLLTEELGPYFSFIWINNSNYSEILGLKFPSLIMFRLEDSQQIIYDGDINVDDMFIWTQHSSLSHFKPLDYNKLFSPDGISIKSTIALIDTSISIQHKKAFQFLGKITSKQGFIKSYYADYIDFKSLYNFFNIKNIPSILYLSSNYTHFEYFYSLNFNENEFDDFFNDNLSLNIIETPKEIYGNFRKVTELSFENMLFNKDGFILFTSAFCIKCKNLKNSVEEAIKIINKFNKNLNFGLWDITLSTPSFQKEKDIGIPSFWYFKNSNISLAKVFNGPINYLSIIEWIHGILPNSFDINIIMNNELGGGFDEI